MYVCICHGVTDRAIRNAAEDSCRDVEELTMLTGCGSTCGNCLPLAAEILAETSAHQVLHLPVLLAA
jgi:bacterioferritin-associated ferredoxin